MRGPSEATQRLSRVLGTWRHSELPVTVRIAAEVATLSIRILGEQAKSDEERARLEAEETAWQIQRIKELLAGKE